MHDHGCARCGQRLAFENSICLNCKGTLAFDSDTNRFVIAGENGLVDPRGARTACRNRDGIGCNWLADPDSSYCRSCRLTRTRPADDDAVAWPEFARAEAAKRRLVVELDGLGLPLIAKVADADFGVCFDLLSSSNTPVTTGHASGVITLDLAEGDDVHREQLRVSMDEPYRTLLGHFRHEIGHYYFTVLVDDDVSRGQFEAAFGDPDVDYQAAIDQHYSQGPPDNWRANYISAYATMHPAEDWAETFAHYLHIRDTIDTAAAFGLAPADSGLSESATDANTFDRIIATWIPLTWALNMINRSMGHADLYPFVIPQDALGKMRLVHQLIVARASGAGAR